MTTTLKTQKQVHVHVTTTPKAGTPDYPKPGHAHIYTMACGLILASDSPMVEQRYVPSRDKNKATCPFCVIKANPRRRLPVCRKEVLL